jgi:hypothetical protein
VLRCETEPVSFDEVFRSLATGDQMKVAVPNQEEGS